MPQARGAREVRRFLGQRLRVLRKAERWSQEALGQRSGLSGKFIGEVERRQKSISMVSLSRIARTLKVQMRLLADVPVDGQPIPSEEAEKVLALLQHRTPAELRTAKTVLTALFRKR
jgi:XRE family transcriptional regulator, regulator of sulfur utilization